MNDVYRRATAMGLSHDDAESLEGTMRGRGVCRACGATVLLIRMTWCPKCGSSRGVNALLEDL